MRAMPRSEREFAAHRPPVLERGRAFEIVYQTNRRIGYGWPRCDERDSGQDSSSCSPHLCVLASLREVFYRIGSGIFSLSQRIIGCL